MVLDDFSGLVMCIRRQLFWAVSVFVALFVWACATRNYVHLSRIDPSEPIHTSNYIEALGGLRPWYVLEVPPRLGSLSVAERVLPDGILWSAIACLSIVVVFWGLIAFGVYLYRLKVHGNVV